MATDLVLYSLIGARCVWKVVFIVESLYSDGSGELSLEYCSLLRSCRGGSVPLFDMLVLATSSAFLYALLYSPE